MVKRVNERPTGYRELGAVIRRTDKAILFDYYGHEVWIPKSALHKIVGGPYCSPSWAIESSKQFKPENLNGQGR